jgi:hypothetical protein
MTDRMVTATSYVGSGASIVSALTLTDVGILIGIATALLTLLLNAVYHWRRDKREREAHAIRVAVLQGEMEDRRRANVPVHEDRRVCAKFETCPYEHDQA